MGETHVQMGDRSISIQIVGPYSHAPKDILINLDTSKTWINKNTSWKGNSIKLRTLGWKKVYACIYALRYKKGKGVLHLMLIRLWGFDCAHSHVLCPRNTGFIFGVRTSG